LHIPASSSVVRDEQLVRLTARREPTAGKDSDQRTSDEVESDDVDRWFGFFTERSHARLAPRQWWEQLPHRKQERPSKDCPWKSTHERGGDVPRSSTVRSFPDPAKPVELPPKNDWITIGPSVVRRGQATGRVARIAIAPRATRIYAATAVYIRV
jgi:hypothetical protein